MAAGSRTRLDPEARRTQLVRLGLDMLSTRPLDQLVVEDIAAAAGISRGLLFHYFPSKRDFHLAVVRAAAADLLERTAPDPDVPFEDQLRASLDAFVDYVGENPDGYVSLVRGAAGGDPALQAIFEDTRRQICQRVIDRLGSEATPPTARLAVRGWVALGEEVIIDWLSEPVEGLDQTRLVELLHDALVMLVTLAVSRTNGQ